MDKFMKAAIEEANKGLNEGGIPQRGSGTISPTYLLKAIFTKSSQGIVFPHTVLTFNGDKIHLKHTEATQQQRLRGGAR